MKRYGVVLCVNIVNKITKYLSDDKKLFQSRVAQPDEEQSFFFHQYFWIVRRAGMLHAHFIVHFK